MLVIRNTGNIIVTLSRCAIETIHKTVFLHLPHSSSWSAIARPSKPYNGYIGYNGYNMGSMWVRGSGPGCTCGLGHGQPSWLVQQTNLHVPAEVPLDVPILTYYLTYIVGSILTLQQLAPYCCRCIFRRLRSVPTSTLVHGYPAGSLAAALAHLPLPLESSGDDRTFLSC